MTTKQDEGGKLLPCPLCGGPAERYTVLPQPGFENRQVQCRQCGCSAFDLKWQCRAPAIPPHNEDGLRKALERLRPPLSVDAFNEVSAGKADFMAMILRADGEGCQDILAQQMQDQTARDIVEIINAVPALLQALGDIPSG